MYRIVSSNLVIKLSNWADYKTYLAWILLRLNPEKFFEVTLNEKH